VDVVAVIVKCCVCGFRLDTVEAHTFHEDECPMAGEDHDVDLDDMPECIEYGRCGEDCHPDCCTVCD
jgi:hypothetical protein